MILKNAKIYSDGVIREGAILISNGIIKSMKFNPSDDDYVTLDKNNKDGKEFDCEKRMIIPGIIDIHSHLRDMDQSEKETFLTGTSAAAFSGITTVFDMPNTKPPAINAEQVKKWMKNARENIFVDVGFIAGVPKQIEEEEIKKIIDLGIVGFKIYPHNPLNDIDWLNPYNIQKLLKLSSKYHIPIFIHPDLPVHERERERLYEKYNKEGLSALKIHDRIYSTENEAKFVNYLIQNYDRVVKDDNLSPPEHPIVHLCHISCKDSFDLLSQDDNRSNISSIARNISFEVTPHHLLLSNDLKLENPNFGKVFPPLREKEHVSYLFQKLEQGDVRIIGTDHAPHTLKEKSESFNDAPSGFPGFETYPFLLLEKLSLNNFVQVASENPAMRFNLSKKGFIKEGNDADVIIIEKVPEYALDSNAFKTKAKFSPYDGYKTSIMIWKVFLRGQQINLDEKEPKGKIVIRE